MKLHIEHEKIRRLAKWAKGMPQPPVRIDLEPTFGCNLKCKFCWQRDPGRLAKADYSKTPTEERLLRLVDEAADLGVMEWQIAGGWEPMVKPRFAAQLMERIKQRGMFGCITTNGTLFTEEMAKRLVELGWDQILFSLEGPDAETHDALTGVPESFEKSLQSMKWFRDYKIALGKKSPRFSFHTVITNKNYDRLAELVRLGADLKVEGIGFESLNVWSDEGEKLKLNEQELREFYGEVRKAVSLARELGVPTTLDKFLKDERLSEKGKMDEIIRTDVAEIDSKLKGLKKGSPGSKSAHKFMKAPCFEPFTSMEIRATGFAVECRLCDNQDNAPSVNEHTLRDIWYGPYMTRIREGILAGNLPAYCGTCAAGIVVDMRKLREEMILLERSPLARMMHKIKRAKNALRDKLRKGNDG